jgi:hypothetical protein
MPLSSSFVDAGLSFDRVIDLINQFLSPLYNAIIIGNYWQSNWNSKEQIWQQTDKIREDVSYQNVQVLKE